MARKRDTTRTTRGDSEWSFSCRTTPYSAYSDSDDSDASVSDSGHDKKSDETELLKDLDLSSREETVVYKPNPFSIAKINAASRGHVALRTKTRGSESSRRSPAIVPLRPDKPKAKTKSAGSNGNIIDGFRKQVQRIAAQPPGRTSNTGLKRSPSRSSIQVGSMAMPLSTAPDHKPKSTPFRSLIPDTTALEACVTPQNRPSVAATPPNVSVTRKLTSPMSVQTSPDPRSVARAPVTNKRTTTRAHISSQNTPSRHQMLHIAYPLANPGDRESKIAYRARAIPFSSPPQQQTRQPELSRSHGGHGRTPMTMSSPLKPARRVDPLDGDISVHSTNRSRAGLVASSGFPDHQYPSASLSPTFAYRSPRARSGPLIRPDDQVLPEDATYPSRYSALSPFLDRDLGPARSESFAMTSALSVRASTPVTPAHMPVSRHCGSMPSPPTTTLDPDVDYSAAPLPISSTQATETNLSQLRAHSEYLYLTEPEPASNRSSTAKCTRELSLSPSPSLSPPRIARLQTPSRRPNKRKPDAYSFVTSDPDESWSTLTKPKKSKTSCSLGIKRSSKFRVPRHGLGASPGKTTRKSGMPATSARRVIVFLPPPLKTSSASADEVVRTTSAANTDQNGRHAYPSRIPSSSPPPHEVVEVMPPPMPDSSGTKSPLEEKCERYRPLSPPLSDSLGPIPREQEQQDDSNLRMSVDLDEIGRMYPRVKAAWRERRRKSEGVWEMLGLPSCGRVYCDGDGEDGVAHERDFRASRSFYAKTFVIQVDRPRLASPSFIDISKRDQLEAPSVRNGLHAGLATGYWDGRTTQRRVYTSPGLLSGTTSIASTPWKGLDEARSRRRAPTWRR
ncbi:hypothetical protein LshimejAT787_0600910 [Lyophyllum shimeji]|uniref:Uncharacterized protein n=1 Tax=Lyophyllum shimeji TaxID=47721 RepID=A0A9P3PNZ4_LYOSH|nr:hypothetical protein LshimejAT787_0600910 [Lyophyllum shimeji]